MNTPHVIAVRCNWCSEQRPQHRVHRLQSNQVICDYCLEWHYHALDFLGGETMPKGCQSCGSTWDQLQAAEPSEQVRMYVVPKDGIMQLLCKTCVQPYTAKRADLYKGTQYGRDLKL